MGKGEVWAPVIPLWERVNIVAHSPRSVMHLSTYLVCILLPIFRADRLNLSKSHQIRCIVVRVDRDAYGGGSKLIVRVLVTIAPLSYRQTLALSLQSSRPHLEVRIVAPEDLDREVERFEPHLVVCNEASSLVRANVLSWVQILFENSLDALVSVDGRASEVHDVSTDDLLGAIDETEDLVSRG